MHGQHREDTKQGRHMCSEPAHVPGTDADSARLKWFYQGGRKISVGDTALFQAGNALPFIGIIRKVIAEKEGTLKLRVNWLYRPGDIELVKGASLDASPNEVFYSFHKDVISAASLLHPCKVAFLPKGVDLPSGVSSLVCRRVYDTANKCLYWLTDQDYADEHQGEVDRLLRKTKHGMQAAGQSDRPSQRALSEIKPESVNVAQGGKSKKRERIDQSLDNLKREKHPKEEEMEPKRERTMRFEEFAALAGKEGGLTSTSHVDQLVQVMAHERADGSKNLVDVVPHRILLAGIVAKTEKEDCLAHFVRFGGLPLLDDWLQEAHKGRLGDGHHKESDKTLEELLLSLLRALERLPVDLDALKTCNVGKSVNLLKSHKNNEVQKKARKLVDTWKKRVNAEMNLLDEAKSGVNSTMTWSSRPSVETLASKGCFAGGLKSSASAQMAINGSGPSGEATSISGYKDVADTTVFKNNSSKAHVSGVSEVVAAIKEEKSCSSSQSQNNSHSWCSGSGKGVGAWKEEGKAASVVSVGNKTTGTALRSHSKGQYSTTTSTGLQRDPSGRHKTSGSEKTNYAALLDKKGSEGANHSGQRLIVRLPNPGRSPAHSTSGGCLLDGGTSNNRGSSSVIIDRQDSLNGNSRPPDIHSPDTSADTKCGNSTTKGRKIGADCKEDVHRSCIASVDDADHKSPDTKHRSRSFPAGKCLPVAHGNISNKKITNPSIITTTPGFSNINPAGPVMETVEGGIDLLASVAACEGSEAEKSYGESTGGEGHHPPITEANRDSTAQGRDMDERDCNGSEADEDGEKQKKDGRLKSDGELPSTGVRECDPAEGNPVLAEDPHGLSKQGQEEGGGIADAPLESVSMEGKAPLSIVEAPVASQDAKIATKVAASDAGNHEHEEDFRASVGVSMPECLADECQVSTPSALDNVASLQEGSENGSKDLPSPSTFPKVSPSCANAGDVASEFYGEDALEVARQVAKEVEQEVQGYGHHEASPDKTDTNLASAECNQIISGDAGDVSRKDVSGERLIEDAAPAGGSVEAGRKEGNSDPSKRESLDASSSCLKDDAKLDPDSEMAAEIPAKVNSDSSLDATPMLSSMEASVLEKESSLPKDKSRDDVERPTFDLNEGLASEEGLHDRVTHALAPVPSPNAPASDRTGFSGHSSSLAAPVAVVSATKGSFIPPSNISRPKAELGWKGSAATSAFRPAEPRRMAETLQPASDMTATVDSTVANDHDGRQARILDIDLNVADDREMEEANLASIGGVDVVSNGPTTSRPELDLNRVDESDESIVLPESKGRLPVVAARAMLDFDLNDGLGCEDAGVEVVSSRSKNFESSSLPAFAETRPETRPTPPEFVDVIPWYTSTSSMPAAMMIPAFSANRPNVSHPVVAGPNAKSAIPATHSFSQFGSNSYQGPTSMSSANVAYPATAFQHAGYPFGGGFPFASTSYHLTSASNVAAHNNTLPFPAATPSQLVSAGAVATPFGRPYLGGYIGGDTTGSDPLVSWARPSLDLNADVMTDLNDSKDEGYGMRSSLGQLQYQQVGASSGSIKRKEPEGGFDSLRSNFKQMAWRE